VSDLQSLDPDTLIALGELILKVAVVLFGGTWAVLLFRLLRQREQAQINLRRSEADIRHTEAQILDLELKTKQAVVLVDMRVETYRHRDAYIIYAVVELTNCGRNTRIIWKDQPPAFSVRMVKLNEEHHGPSRRIPMQNGIEDRDYDLIGEFRVLRTLDPKAEARSHIVRAGGKESLPFTALVPSPGLYLLSFRGVVDEKDRAEAAKLGVELPVAWTGNRYVFVDDARVPSAGDNIRSSVVANLK